jgi:hypothetical protein
MGDEDVICFRDVLYVKIFWQYIWAIEPGVEEDDQAVGAQSICSRAFGLD